MLRAPVPYRIRDDWVPNLGPTRLTSRHNRLISQAFTQVDYATSGFSTHRAIVRDLGILVFFSSVEQLLSSSLALDLAWRLRIPVSQLPVELPSDDHHGPCAVLKIFSGWHRYHLW